MMRLKHLISPERDKVINNVTNEGDRIVHVSNFLLVLPSIIAALLPYLMGEWEERTQSFKDQARAIRRGFLTLFVGLYMCTMIYESPKFLTAPVAHGARSSFFPGPETNLEDIVGQEFSKSMDKHMSSPVITRFLQTLQFKCREQAFQDGDEALDFFLCELSHIEYSGLEENNNHPVIPCTDEALMNRIVRDGDHQPYDALPEQLIILYDENNVEYGDRVPPQYGIHQGFGMFAPLFAGESDDSEELRGPLPLLNYKLNCLARSLGLNFALFQDGHGFEQSSAVPRRPPADTTDPVELNHHWDILMRCDPHHIRMVLKISTRDNASPIPLWWTYQFDFWRHGHKLGMYRAYLAIDTSEFYHENTVGQLFIPVSTIVLFAMLLVPAAVPAIVCAPFWMLKLIMKKGKFRKLVYCLFDPTGYRVSISTSLYKVALENLGCFCTLVGFVFSLCDLFMRKGSAYYVKDLDQTLSPFSYWRYKGLSRPMIATNVCFAMWRASVIHALAVSCYTIRLLEMSSLFNGSDYIMMTFLFAFFPVLHFCVVFSIVVVAFGLLAHTLFGHVFPQYSTLSGSVWALVLYAFSFSESAKNEDLVYPMVEKDAFGLQILHLVFIIIVVTVMLNMFTTIVIDAYQIAIDRCTSTNKMLRLKAAAWYHFKKAFGYYHELQEEVDILGGRPGKIFMRATVSRDHPLDVNDKSKPDTESICQRLIETLGVLQRARSFVILLERQQRMANRKRKPK